MNEEQKTGPYNKGDVVPSDGEYVCSPCGYHHAFHKDEKFSECISCMAGTSEGDDEFAEGLELWEKSVPVEETKQDEKAA